MKLTLALASLLALGALGLARKSADRPVFVSAQALAASCRAIKDIVGSDYLAEPSKPFVLTGADMAAVGRCMGYVEGVTDEFRVRNSLNSHYHPSIGRGEIPILISAFLQRVAEHPEEGDTAASTVLHEADNDLLRNCGDCGLGMIAYPR